MPASVDTNQSDTRRPKCRTRSDRAGPARSTRTERFAASRRHLGRVNGRPHTVEPWRYVVQPGSSEASPGPETARPDRRFQRLLPIGREIGMVGFGILVYGAVRAVTEGSAAQAIANAQAIERIERTLGIAWEASAQSLAMTSEVLIDLGNWVYIWGHWPVILAALVIMYFTRRGAYRLLRNAMFISGMIGFAFFFAVPTAPPRLAGMELVDTVLERSASYRTLQPPSLTNQFAAMPSLHFGWNLLVGVILFIAFTSFAVRVFAVGMPVLMGIATVTTANHFVLDLIVGAVVVAIAVGIAVGIERLEWRPHWPPRLPGVPRARPGYTWRS